MKAVSGYWTRALLLIVFALMAGTLLVGGQSSTSMRAGTAAAHAKVVDLIPASLSGESNQSSEPFLAVQAANPQVMVASAFTPNPISNTGNAPVHILLQTPDRGFSNTLPGYRLIREHILPTATAPAKSKSSGRTGKG